VGGSAVHGSATDEVPESLAGECLDIDVSASIVSGSRRECDADVMASSQLSIDGITLGEDDLTVFPVDQFSWASSDGLVQSLKTMTVVRSLNEVSPLVVSLFQTGEPRGALLACTDDAGTLRLRLDLTDARVTSYMVNGGGAGDPVEQFTLEASTVEMTCGSNFVDIT
jgi:hypothetical protein